MDQSLSGVWLGKVGSSPAGLEEQPVNSSRRRARCVPRGAGNRAWGLGWRGRRRHRRLMAKGSVTVVTRPVASAAVSKGGEIYPVCHFTQPLTAAAGSSSFLCS